MTLNRPKLWKLCCLAPVAPFNERFYTLQLRRWQKKVKREIATVLHFWFAGPPSGNITYSRQHNLRLNCVHLTWSVAFSIKVLI